MSAPGGSTSRLDVVRQCVDQLWESGRDDGRWSALEKVLILILDPKKEPRSDKTHAVDAPRAPLAKAPARDNVILLWTPARAARWRKA